MLTVFGWCVLGFCWYLIACMTVLLIMHMRIPAERYRELDALARTLEGSRDQWAEVWEGRMSWPSFQEWFRARLAEEVAKPASFKEGFFYELFALGVELVDVVFRFRSDAVRARWRMRGRFLSRV